MRAVPRQVTVLMWELSDGAPDTVCWLAVVIGGQRALQTRLGEREHRHLVDLLSATPS